MQEVIKAYLDQIKIGRKQSFKNLAIFPLLSTYSSDLDYLLLDEALREGLVEVVEVSKEGSVPELKVTNKSPRMILILDGEELVGAKQNRIVNTTILIQGNTTIIIPVSCVEQRRWTYDSPRFSSGERIMTSHIRGLKAEQVYRSVRESGKYRSDQGAIWDEISSKAARRGAASPSMAMNSIYEKDRGSTQEYLKHFSSIQGQMGAVFLINGKVMGLDSFGNPGTFSKTFKKLVESYALDAIDWFDPAKEEKALKSEVTKLIKEFQITQMEIHPSVGLGTDCRMESKKITGFALALDDQILHLCIFYRDNEQRSHESGSRSSRAN